MYLRESEPYLGFARRVLGSREIHDRHHRVELRAASYLLVQITSVVCKKAAGRETALAPAARNT